ncbi:MAG: MBL fold metallo-hydrolase [Bacteroidota bacterium]
MKLYSIDTENFKLDGGAMFGVVPKVMWQKIYPCDENNLCPWAMRLLLIDSGDRKILVDSGIGDKQDAKFMGNYHLFGEHTLAKSLAAHGFTHDDITDVIHTHLHFDHCGGSVKKVGEALVPAFPNANYWISRRQWEWATNPNRREKASFLKENILPLQEHGKVKLVEEDGELFPGISVQMHHGHTDGHMIVLVKYNEKTFVYMGDVFPAHVHIPIPFVMSYDTRPMLSLEEREKFLKEAIENNYILIFEHDIDKESCTLQMTEKGVRAKEFFKLKELL